MLMVSDIKLNTDFVLQILEQWGCNKKQVRQLLLLDKSDPLNFDEKQMERLHFILHIHEGLNTYFNNPENIYGFVKMANNNPPFCGISPLDFLLNGTDKEFKAAVEHIRNLIIY
jgi:hypothetical protein